MYLYYIPKLKKPQRVSVGVFYTLCQHLHEYFGGKTDPLFTFAKGSQIALSPLFHICSSPRI